MYDYLDGFDFILIKLFYRCFFVQVKIYFEKDLSEFKMNITKIFEQLALKETAARLIINESQFISSFVAKIKDQASDQIKATSLQMVIFFLMLNEII